MLAMIAVIRRIPTRLFPARPLLFLLAGLATQAADFQGSHHIVAYEEVPFQYSKTEPTDAVARAARRLESGELKLEFSPEHGYLLSLLKALEIPVSSQTLVFSKTSLHRDLISPSSPRALFFNDDVYVGWVRWAPVLEISAADPKLGGVFYVLAQSKDEPPRLVRNHSCVECHVSRFSMGVPGHLLRSVRTDPQGQVGDITGGVRVSHDTAYPDRRGGWYVTGRYQDGPDLGNLVGLAEFAQREADPTFHANLTELSGIVDTTTYPSPHSDLVAMMVLEHQVHMHNFIARLHYESSLRLHQYGHVRYVHKIADSFLEYLLFTGEPELEGPVHGTSTFAADFQKRGPRDSQGRSLRDLDLQTRLFKYPCSFLIYSDAFDGLPQPIRDYLYQRLWDILTGQDDSGRFEHLRNSTRRAILEILLETKPGLPESWKLENARHHSR